MNAMALKCGLEHIFSKRRAPRSLRTVLQHLMNKPRSPRGTPPAPLAGRRVLLAGDDAGLAAALRQAGADVLQAACGPAVLEQLRARDSVEAVLLPLDAAGAEALATVRAIRASRAPWASVPVVGVGGPAEAAAAAAGIDGLLARPVENTLLYAALTRFMSGGAARAPRPEPAAAATSTTVVPESLLNMPRLESYRRLGMLEELVNDYLPEMRRLVGAVADAAHRCDAQASLAALHSLLGMSGEAGAQGLYQHVRKLYVPLLEQGQWPAAADWLPQLKQLAGRTEEALRAYCAQQARSGAA